MNHSEGKYPALEGSGIDKITRISQADNHQYNKKLVNILVMGGDDLSWLFELEMLLYQHQESRILEDLPSFTIDDAALLHLQYKNKSREIL